MSRRIGETVKPVGDRQKYRQVQSADILLIIGSTGGSLSAITIGRLSGFVDKEKSLSVAH